MTESLNGSGRNVLGYRVLLLMDETKEKTEGGIIIPDSYNEKQRYAQDSGTIVDMGATAFDDLLPSERPKIGARCDIKKYDGIFLDREETPDKKEYRIVNDDQILTLIK